MTTGARSGFAIALMVLGSTMRTWAEEYLVENTAELKAAVAKAGPGDAIVMREASWSNVTIHFQGKGTEKSPIILRAQNSGKVVIAGTSSLKIDGEYLVVDGLVFKNGQPNTGKLISFGSSSRPSHHCRLTNTAIMDYNNPDRKKKYYWVSLYGTHNRVDHCLFSEMKNIGVTVVVWIGDDDPPNYHRIDHNFFDRRPEGDGNGYETLRIGDSKRSMKNSHTTAEYNLFSQCDGETEIISNKACENTYRHNTFVNCKGMLTLRHGNRCVVEGNFFFGAGNDGTGGIRVMGEGHRIINNYLQDVGATDYHAAISLMNGVPDSPLNRYFQVKDCIIAHNTLVNTKWSITSGGNHDKGAPLPPEDTLIANNLVLGKRSPMIKYFGTKQPDVTYRGNIMYGADLGIDIPGGIRIEDPRMVESADGLWRPDADSPIIGAAEAEIRIQMRMDMDGQPVNDKRSIGADEPSKAAIRIRPLGPGDVGPGWRLNLKNIKRSESSAPGNPSR
ncbi:MAG: polysaccharide lyase 6 family protein [Planctomycetota bacterium]